MILRTVLAAAVVLSAVPAAAPSVASAEPKLRTVCEGFRPLSGVPTYLRQVDFFEGAITDNATLAPDTSDESTGKLVNTWTFQPGADITLICGYGTTRQSRKLPASTTVCTATFAPTKGNRGWKPVNVSCG